MIILLQEFKNNTEEKIEEITIEDVKVNILKLINLNENNRVIIKDILKSYNVNIAPDLNKSQLVEFNHKLLGLLK